MKFIARNGIHQLPQVLGPSPVRKLDKQWDWDSHFPRKVFQMSQLRSTVIAVLLLATMVAQDVSQTLSAPRQIGDFRTAYLINDNADPGVFDKLSTKILESGYWKIVGQSEKADLLLVLSEKQQTAYLRFNPITVFEGDAFYYFHPPVATEIDTLTLAVVDRAANRQLLTISCARHRFPSAPVWLASRLSAKMEKKKNSSR